MQAKHQCTWPAIAKSHSLVLHGTMLCKALHFCATQVCIPVSMFSSTMHSPVSSTQSHGSVPGTTAITSPGTSICDGIDLNEPPRSTSTCARTHTHTPCEHDCPACTPNCVDTYTTYTHTSYSQHMMQWQAHDSACWQEGPVSILSQPCTTLAQPTHHTHHTREMGDVSQPLHVLVRLHCTCDD